MNSLFTAEESTKFKYQKSPKSVTNQCYLQKECFKVQEIKLYLEFASLSQFPNIENDT